MIRQECFEKEWIDKVCSSHKFKHPELVEKVIRAFSLLGCFRRVTYEQ